MIPIFTLSDVKEHLIAFTVWKKSRGFRYLPGVKKFYNYNGVEITEEELLNEYFKNNTK